MSGVLGESRERHKNNESAQWGGKWTGEMQVERKTGVRLRQNEGLY